MKLTAKQRLAKYAYGGGEEGEKEAAKSKRKFNADKYTAFGDNSQLAFDEGWYPITSGLQGSTTYVNDYKPFNDVLSKTTPGGKDHFRIVGNTNGTFNVGLYDNKGNMTQLLDKGVKYDFLSKRYFTGKGGIVDSRANQLQTMVPNQSVEKVPDLDFSKMAFGGDVSSYAQILPMVEGLIGLIGKKKEYSTQPILTDTAIHNMSNPYSHMAFGGTVEDLTEEEYADLQAMADEQGIAIEEMLEQVNSELGSETEEDYTGETGEEEFAYGGKKNWIQKAVNPKHKGYCTPMTKSTCTPRRKALARTFKKHHGFHAMGGESTIEVEDNEIVHEPGKRPVKMNGATHENGGIDIDVKPGTRIYSDRLGIDGKSMQQRKANREKRLNKINSLLDKYPNNNLTKATVGRSLEHLDAEEEKDMALQKVANKIYGQGGEAAYGDGIPDYLSTRNTPSYSVIEGEEGIPDYLNSHTAPSYSVAGSNIPKTITNNNPNTIGNPTIGDYIGMAGTVGSSVAGLLNTNAAARASRPNVNRFLGFGREAIQSNDNAQGLASTMLGSTLEDIDMSTNAAVKRNRNSAGGVNTGRALDIATYIEGNKAKTAARDASTAQLMSLMGNRGQLTNARDYYEMQGQTDTDTEDAMDTASYYSNRGQDLQSLFEGVQVAGRNFNISKGNQVDANLISQLSQYGLEFDEDGNLITK